MQKKVIIILLFFSLLTPALSYAYQSPGKPTGHVNDFAGVLSVSQKSDIELRLSEYKKTTSVEIAVVTIPSLQGEVIESYAVSLFQEWGIGQKGKDNGLLILVAPNDREARIEVGYGLEGAVTDLQAGNIVNRVMIPAFKTGDYYSGINGAVDAVISVISKSPEGEQFSKPAPSPKVSGNIVEFILFLVFIFFGVFMRIFAKTKSWWLGGVVGALVGIVVWIIWGLAVGIIAVIIFTVLGLLLDFFASRHGPYDGNHPGGFWFGPGMGGHSGSGGFGGFGGGFSGGGGASGRW